MFALVLAEGTNKSRSGRRSLSALAILPILLTLPALSAQAATPCKSIDFTSINTGPVGPVSMVSADTGAVYTATVSTPGNLLGNEFGDLGKFSDGQSAYVTLSSPQKVVLRTKVVDIQGTLTTETMRIVSDNPITVYDPDGQLTVTVNAPNDILIKAAIRPDAGSPDLATWNLTTTTANLEIKQVKNGDYWSSMNVNLGCQMQSTLDVVKVADKPVVTAAGEVITYSYTVTNTGNVSLTGVAVNDSHNASGPVPVPSNEVLVNDVSPANDSLDNAQDNVWDLLAPGDSITFTAQYTVTQQDWDTLK